MVQFKSLSDEDCREIIDLHLSFINDSLAKYYISADLTFTLDESIYDYIKKN
jgi:ATP-dependent Clp protease ATP-binding subunit ClpA